MTREDFLKKLFETFPDFFNKESTSAINWAKGYKLVLHQDLKIDFNKLFNLMLTNWNKLKTPPDPNWFKQFFATCKQEECIQLKLKKETEQEEIPTSFYEAKQKLQNKLKTLSNKYRQVL